MLQAKDAITHLVIEFDLIGHMPTYLPNGLTLVTQVTCLTAELEIGT